MTSIQYTNYEIRFELELRRYNLFNFSNARATVGTFGNNSVKERSARGFNLLLQKKKNSLFTYIRECRWFNLNIHLWECIRLCHNLHKRTFRSNQSIQVRVKSGIDRLRHLRRQNRDLQWNHRTKQKIEKERKGPHTKDKTHQNTSAPKNEKKGRGTIPETTLGRAKSKGSTKQKHRTKPQAESTRNLNKSWASQNSQNQQISSKIQTSTENENQSPKRTKSEDPRPWNPNQKQGEQGFPRATWSCTSRSRTNQQWTRVCNMIVNAQQQLWQGCEQALGRGTASAQNDRRPERTADNGKFPRVISPTALSAVYVWIICLLWNTIKVMIIYVIHLL